MAVNIDAEHAQSAPGPRTQPAAATTAPERPARSNALQRGEHGTTACYAQRCPCARCRRAARASERIRRAELAVLHGRAPLYRCSTKPMLDAIAELRGRGMTLAAIATGAGLNVEAFRRALRRGSTTSDVVRRVLAL